MGTGPLAQAVAVDDAGPEARHRLGPDDAQRRHRGPDLLGRVGHERLRHAVVEPAELVVDRRRVDPGVHVPVRRVHARLRPQHDRQHQVQQVGKEQRPVVLRLGRGLEETVQPLRVEEIRQRRRAITLQGAWARNGSNATGIMTTPPKASS